MWMNEELKNLLVVLGIMVVAIIVLWILFQENKRNALLTEQKATLEARVAMFTAGELILANLFVQNDNEQNANKQAQADRIKEHMKELFKSSSELIRLAILINSLPDALSTKMLRDIFWSLCYQQNTNFWVNHYFRLCANNNQLGQKELEKIFSQLSS